ncbi:MAG: DUF3891 family protein, partial [Ginsengibacter sp.]
SKESGNNNEAKSFLKNQTLLRKKWLQQLKINETEALRIYDLVEWCDACSLLLCQNLVQPEKRKLEVSTGPDKKSYSLAQTGDKKITINPWPFENDKFEVNFEWRLIKKLQFSTSTEFRKEFLKAKVKETTWEVVKDISRKKKNKV